MENSPTEIFTHKMVLAVRAGCLYLVSLLGNRLAIVLRQDQQDGGGLRQALQLMNRFVSNEKEDLISLHPLFTRHKPDPFKQPDNLGGIHTLTTLSNEVWRTTKSKAFKLNASDFQPPEGEWCHYCYSNLGSETTGQQLIETPIRRDQFEVGSKAKGNTLVCSRKGML